MRFRHKSARDTSFVDDLGVNVMLCSLDDRRISYLNRASLEGFGQLAHVLPVPPDRLLGVTRSDRARIELYATVLAANEDLPSRR